MVEYFGCASRSAHPPVVVPDQPIDRHDSGPTSPRSCRPKALIIFHKVNGIGGPADRFGIAPSAPILDSRAAETPRRAAHLQLPSEPGAPLSSCPRPSFRAAEDGVIAPFQPHSLLDRAAQRTPHR